MPAIRKWSARMGQLPPGAVTLVETVADAEAFAPRDASKLAYVTQTTLSVDDTARHRRACSSGASRRSSGRTRKTSATPPPTGRRRSSASRRRSTRMIVVGAPNSSNSQRLKEVAERAGCPHAVLVQRAAEIDWTSSAASRRSASPPAPRRPRCWSRRSSTPSPQRYDVSVETVSGRRGGGVLPAAPPAAGDPGRGVSRMAVYTDVSRRRSRRAFSPATISASCCPTRASPRASRIPISSSTPAPAISS